MWLRGSARNSLSYFSCKRTLSDGPHRYVAQISDKVANKRVDNLRAEQKINLGVMPDVEFKEHLHAKISARLDIIESDQEIFELDKN